jgi:hypothetical protein
LSELVAVAARVEKREEEGERLLVYMEGREGG